MTDPCPAPDAARRTALPDLPTAVGLAGTMRHAEVAGAMSLETGIVTAIILYSISDR